MFRKLIISLLLACLVIGGTGSIVFAQSKDSFRCEKLPKISDVLSMTPGEIWTEIQSGQTIEDLFAQKDLNYSDFQQQWVDVKTECIDQALADNKIIEAQADRLKENLQEKLAKGKDFKNWFFPNMHKHAWLNNLFGRAGKGLGQVLLDELSMSTSELKDAFQSGQTLQELVREKGINADELYHTWLSDQIAVINKKLAAGVISQQQAETTINRLQQQLDQPFPWNQLHEFQQMKRNQFGHGDVGGGFRGQMQPQNPRFQPSNEF